MKRGRTVRRNRKKIGKNEGKEETAETQSFVRYSCSPLHSSSIQLSINLTFGGGAISSRRWLTHSTLPMVFARRWGANRVFLPYKENGTVSSLFSLSIIPISNFFVTYRLLTFVTYGNSRARVEEGLQKIGNDRCASEIWRTKKAHFFDMELNFFPLSIILSMLRPILHEVSVRLNECLCVCVCVCNFVARGIFRGRFSGHETIVTDGKNGLRKICRNAQL